MTCKACECVVGEDYYIGGGRCGVCDTPAVPYEQRVKYIGTIKEDIHAFVLDVPRVCSGCGVEIRMHELKCGYAGRDMEMEKFFGINKPHWVGR